MIYGTTEKRKHTIWRNTQWQKAVDALEALTAEREETGKVMALDNPQKTDESCDRIWNTFWRDYGWDSHNREETLTFELYQTRLHVNSWGRGKIERNKTQR